MSVLYWIAAILIVAGVLVSVGYTFWESVFIGTFFLPGALAAGFFYPKVSFKDKGSGIRDAIFITFGIILGEILVIIIAGSVISLMRYGHLDFENKPVFPDILTNPVFISIIVAILCIGNYFWGRWLNVRYPREIKPVVFLSERKAVSLYPSEIQFIESNDSFTTVHASDERSFRNKTSISQWEAILGEMFIRVHRSYLVNRNAVTSVEGETVTVDGYELPISRKYRENVKGLC